MPVLYIGNKNYSSWSMRAWVLMRQTGMEFDEVKLRFDGFAPDSEFKRQIEAVTPTGKVPVLVDGDVTVWDTLAIAEYLAEYLAEQHQDKPLWPRDRAARAHARSVVAEMHSGFTALRSHCPMNIEARLPEVGATIWREQPDVRADVQRLEQMWAELLARHGGPLLFGAFTIADAFFAPICMRLLTYGLPLSPTAQAYVQSVSDLPAVREWVQAALAEHDFRPFEEPYRSQP